MHKIIKKLTGFVVISIALLSLSVFNTYAQDPSAETPQSAALSSICKEIDAGTSEAYKDFPKCASSPSQCRTNDKYKTPINCFFLEEPIGGEPGYDLYKITCMPKPDDPYHQQCSYTLWHGEAIGPGSRGPVQALLSYEAGKEYQAGLGLFYNYLALIYKFMSGIIVGFVILISIIGGITMTTSSGNQEQFDKGKTMITKALIGMVLWFLASVILYTINPTFFVF